MTDLVIYDTSDFSSYPLGGQLTSIQNFLRYLSESNRDLASRTVLVGVTLDPTQVGKFQYVETSGFVFKFLPVAVANNDENNPRRSLRLAYVKGLCKYLRKLHLSADDVNLIETPEAFSPVRVWGGRNCYVFSHGSFLEMEKNLRFFSNTLIAKSFQRYLLHVIRAADGIFVLDQETQKKYGRYNMNVYVVRNAIERRQQVHREFDPKAIHLLFVGRLSSVKGIPQIIEAAEAMPDVSCLTIVGAGELYSSLTAVETGKTVLVGSVPHDGVQDYMCRNDILVMNSSHEGVPMVILEAMSVGMPIVSTPVGGISETVAWECNAEPTDGEPDSIIAAVRKVAANYGSYSESAYEQAGQYHYSEVNAHVLSLLPVSINNREL